MKTAFVGLGDMGRGMARNLVRNGVDLTVCSRSGSCFDEFEQLGAKTTTSYQEVAGCKLIFLCLPDDEAVRDVICGAEGMLFFLRAGQIVVDCSTIRYSTTLEMAALLAQKNAVFLDAPVSGQHKRAMDGTLTIMCGGDEETFTRIKPYFAYMGEKILYMGRSGNGQLTKLINQLLYDINAAALAEILPLSVKMGLDSEKLGEVINSGTGRSYASEFYIPQDLEGRFGDGYSMKKAYKDLISAAELSAREGIPTPVLSAATVTYQMALLQGYGDENKGAMLKVYEELLGVKFRKKGLSTDGNGAVPNSV